MSYVFSSEKNVMRKLSGHGEAGQEMATNPKRGNQLKQTNSKPATGIPSTDLPTNADSLGESKL